MKLTPSSTARLTTRMLEMTGTYVTVFMLAAGAYLTALALVHVLSPRLKPVRFE